MRIGWSLLCHSGLTSAEHVEASGSYHRFAGNPVFSVMPDLIRHPVFFPFLYSLYLRDLRELRGEFFVFTRWPLPGLLACSSV